ncbi:MAG: sigma-70 family RNA polymerase sigma factor [Candidatus Andeanibacterium colombiense]|uniref:Sigma-70 family RNA polymerase sigma factor n=1 Tax=Candidatus Andeanibacterium colombiense TaxID=3121345 RepID=A0AAJ5X5W7_9SPHN|nr:MAG: sigma-70 family RNA polymerase sigma factor [Sphingomonadaceae bacterium]
MAGADSGDVLDWRGMRPGLVRFLARRTGCVAAAEDLVQDLWLRLDGAERNGGAQPRNPVSYLFAAAANLARDHARAEKRRAALNAEAMRLVFDGLPAAASAAASPEREAEATQELASVVAIIDRLPPRTREIFALNRFEGVSYRQIALRLAISTTAVEKHMKRALDALAGMRDGGTGIVPGPDGVGR